MRSSFLAVQLEPAASGVTRHILKLAAMLGILTASGCIPYTVGSTAEIVPVGRMRTAASYYFIPNGVTSPDDSTASPLAGIDLEWRYGLDLRSDAGLRLTPGGAIVNYKRRMTGTPLGPATAWMLGTGIVNAGEHAHLEATLIASGDPRAQLFPYGGLRAMQVVPITRGAVHDSPTIGGFFGMQLGAAGFALRPELAVYYDRSALDLRSGSIIAVPAITVQRGNGGGRRLPVPVLGRVPARTESPSR